ncbi:hypothetical protein CYY_006178 [Polysphondylium violaceum]|uniref:Type A von Willebrand factor domain-containing protein n=1 Tax=Polysphondylium violaceum TaxID=133409 RepID=A0A8J4URP0_9MYCE|nr:hypothetical protein CYY_006178 [Polysphondylium violaceum]
MNAASKYTWVGEDEEDEIDLDDDEMVIDQQQQNPNAPTSTTTTTTNTRFAPQQEQKKAGGFFSNLFGSSNSNNNNSTQSFSAPPPPQQRQRVVQKTKVKKSNTNVLVTKVGILESETTIATGDPIFCKKCKVCFSNINKFDMIQLNDGTQAKNVPTSGGLQQGEGEAKKWICEFCSEVNEINIFPEEIPQSNIVDYILESIPVDPNNNNLNVEEKPKKKSFDESPVVFCIDTSGSMVLTSLINDTSKINPKYFNKTDPEFKKYGDTSNSHNSPKYISRLDCVKMGIDSQLDDFYKEVPNKKVGIVTFSSTVTVIGDGLGLPAAIPSDAINSLSKLIEHGTSHSIENPISKSKYSLDQIVEKLKGAGSTALGPAAAVCVGMGAASPGSKIVLCTDGEANLGLGSVEDRDPKASMDFYTQLAELARNNGTTISVLAIKGTNTKLEFIGKLANITGGEIDIVDPLNLSDDFKSALALPTIATNVSLKLFLHSGLYVTNNGEKCDNSSVENVIGNANKETTVAFEYGVKSRNLIDKDLKSIPFQLQLYYTTLDGKKCVRIITQTQEITTDKNLAEQHADIDVLGINLVQQSSKIASKGDYSNSRAKNVTNANYLDHVMNTKITSNNPVATESMDEQISSTAIWKKQAQKLETHLASSIKKEKSEKQQQEGADLYSYRQSSRSDTTANVLYNMSSMSKTKAKKF